MKKFPINASAILITTVLVAGCIGGLSHAEFKIPPLEVSGTIEKNQDTLLIVAPEFYGSSEAFLAILKEDFSDATLYKWKITNITDSNAFKVRFKEQIRRVGFVFPQTLDKENLNSRMLFLREKGGKYIYKIAIVGNRVSVEKTDGFALKKSLPSSLQIGALDEWGGPRERQMEEETEFYHNVRWQDATALRASEVYRSNKIDIIKIVMQSHENS